ncbi:FAD-dependent oxidoreductase [Reinekea forsetii]|uniref:2-polyprenyl-6-methoxyphenol hydroxylase n=1 Tax=Reinekea forsetii TaxID=1336806 RepID=A0A2K8KQV4_9GAMM|nr:NAD(P)/FAD-dependent oxidoreductase [Reinekea forsetii]ATX76439.1 2-polyprenyl-6-methoxyphenol hydroxylase [Reinekea forsetii]
MNNNTVKKITDNWTLCPACQGRGQKSKAIRKSVRLRYQRDLAQFQTAPHAGTAPVRPKGHLDACQNCSGSGLIQGASQATLDRTPDYQNYPYLAIVGAGIGGVALAVACLHRRIPFTLFERDSGFAARSQGYGLTLQQASRAIEGLGIVSLEEGVVSTRHVVHTPDGTVIADWGIRDLAATALKSSTRTNVHIARQALRLALLEQLGDDTAVQWGHQLVQYSQTNGEGVELSFQVAGGTKQVKADLLVGADGIRSSVRQLLMGEDVAPLRYLGCIVILGICPLDAIDGVDRALLDSATVFQTANGHERIYLMPYAADSIMWQLSYPMPEQAAQALSAQGPEALKAEALRRCQWHAPIPQILTATHEAQISGYPVYDRALLESSQLQQGAQVTLIGDAAHPMSPFKGQGANQALLDALALARAITKNCGPSTPWRQQGLRASVLNEFEAEMLARSATKVKDSAEAAQFLHSDVVLHEGNEPRGRVLQRAEDKK